MADKIFTPEETAEITEIVNAAVLPISKQVADLEASNKMLEEANTVFVKQIKDLQTDKMIAPSPATIEVAKATDVKPEIPKGEYEVQVGEETVKVKFLKAGPYYMAEAKRQVTSEEVAADKTLLAALVEKGSNIIEVVE